MEDCLSHDNSPTRVAGQIQQKYHQIQLKYSLNNSLYATDFYSSHAKSILKMKAGDRMSAKNVAQIACAE